MRQMIIASALLAVFSSQVQAASGPVISQAQTNVTGLTFQVTDLKTTDRISPTFKLGNNTTSLNVDKYFVPYLSERTSLPVNGTFFDNTSNSLASTDGRISVNKQGNGLKTSATADAEAFQILPDREHSGYVGSDLSGYVSSSSYWQLSAYTQVTITGQVAGNFLINAAPLSGLNSINQDVKLNVSVSNGMGISLHNADVYDDYSDAKYTFNMNGEQTVSSLGVVSSHNPTDSATNQFSITYRNNTNKTMNLNLYFNETSRIEWTRTTAVPEPGTWVLMTLGLAGLARSVRIRRRLDKGLAF